MARKKITQVTAKEIEGIINNSVQSAKNRLVGNAAEQKKMFVRPIANTDGSPSVAKLVQRLAAETEEAMQQLENNVEDLEDSLVAPPPADSIPLSGVFLTYDRDTETLEIVGEQGVDEEDVSEIVGTETNEKFTELDNSITALSNSKQDKLEIADNYDSTTNKVATEATISKEVAKVIGGAGESFDTLKEIADWIIAHPNSVAEINAKIAENTAKINTHTRDIALNNSKADRNTSDIAAQAQRITSVQSSVNALSTSKQDKLSIADGYSLENPVATVRTVSDKIAEVVGGADASFDTLKEIADWINNNPESVAAINAKLSEHAQAIANNAEGITENALAIEENEEAIRQAEVKATQAANTANEAARRIGIAEVDIANLRDGKQNVLMFADEYSEQSKVATERTVEREVAKIVADAPDNFNTLKEIAAWIAAHPNDISMLNALIQENSRGIALNASLIVNNTKAINDNAKRINNVEIGLNDANEYYSRLSKTVEDKADKDSVSNIIDTTVGKTNMPNQLYGTDADGNPALYPTDSVGTSVFVDGQKVKEFNADEKLDKTTAWNKVYGTDGQGNQTTYDVDKIGNWSTVLVGGERVVEFNADSKQDKIEIADGYNAVSNKVATVATVNDRVSPVSNAVYANSLVLADQNSRLKEAEKEILKKQNQVVIADGYSESNPVATVNTVSNKIAEIVAGAPASFDTLKEIADWINDNPGNAQELNERITQNAEDIKEVSNRVDDKVTKTAAPNKVYGTDENGEQIAYTISELQGKDEVILVDVEKLTSADNGPEEVALFLDLSKRCSNGEISIIGKLGDTYGFVNAIAYSENEDGTVAKADWTVFAPMMETDESGIKTWYVFTALITYQGGWVSMENWYQRFVSPEDLEETLSGAKGYTDKAVEDLIPASEKGKANGVATLGSDGKITKEESRDVDLNDITKADRDGFVKEGIINNGATLTDKEKRAVANWLAGDTDSMLTGGLAIRTTNGDVRVPSKPSSMYSATSSIYVDNLPDYLTLTDEEKTSWTDMIGAVPKWVPDAGGYTTVIGLAYNGTFTKFKLAFGKPVNSAIACYDSRGSGHNVLGTDTPVNPTDCANKEYVDNNFVAKQPIPQSGSYVYAFDPNGGRTQQYTPANVVYSLVQRRDGNTFDCGTPIDEVNVTNKKYVDNLPDYFTPTDEQKAKWRGMIGASGTKLYLHTLTGDSLTNPWHVLATFSGKILSGTSLSGALRSNPHNFLSISDGSANLIKVLHKDGYPPLQAVRLSDSGSIVAEDIVMATVEDTVTEL